VSGGQSHRGSDTRLWLRLWPRIIAIVIPAAAAVAFLLLHVWPAAVACFAFMVFEILMGYLGVRLLKKKLHSTRTRSEDV
jgi:membrane protein implicated in regulation of membrane protease activity